LSVVEIVSGRVVWEGKHVKKAFLELFLENVMFYSLADRKKM